MKEKTGCEPFWQPANPKVSVNQSDIFVFKKSYNFVRNKYSKYIFCDQKNSAKLSSIKMIHYKLL